jgi:hypothetical protein
MATIHIPPPDAQSDLYRLDLGADQSPGCVALLKPDSAAGAMLLDGRDLPEFILMSAGPFATKIKPLSVERYADGVIGVRCLLMDEL